MKELRFTLLSEGPTDRALIPILVWLLHSQGVKCAIQPEWADLRRLRLRSKLSLSEKIWLAIDLYPCDLLFIHRDADREPREKRYDEITSALSVVQREHVLSNPAICVIPVRMQEAWLLFDLQAIRHAAGNSRGRQALTLPPVRDLERLPDPKKILDDLLMQASGLRGHRLDRMDVSAQAIRVTSFIKDFSPLRVLPAFAALEDDVSRTIDEQRWGELNC